MDKNGSTMDTESAEILIRLVRIESKLDFLIEVTSGLMQLAAPLVGNATRVKMLSVLAKVKGVVT